MQSAGCGSAASFPNVAAVTVYRNRHRGGRWCYTFRAGGVRYQGYCIDPATGEDAPTRPRAIELEALIRRAVRGNAGRSVSRPGTFTLAEALRLHIEGQTESTPLHVANLELYARELLDHFGADRAIADIDQVDVDTYRTTAAKAGALVWKGGPRKRARMKPDQVARFMVRTGRRRSAASTNHYLDCLRSAFAVAARIRDPVTGKPMLPHPPEVKPLPTPKRQPRPMPDAELYARLEVAPPWTREAAELARYFGLRRAEALGLTVDHVDRERRGLRFSGAEAKSGRDEWAMPIAGGWEFLMALERQARARRIRHLIAWPGQAYKHLAIAGKPGEIPRKAWRPLKSVRRSWRRSALEAEVDSPHRMHDVRARYITEIAKRHRGVAKDAARHADPETTERYIAVATSEVGDLVRGIGRPEKGRRIGSRGTAGASPRRAALRRAK